MEKIGVGYAYVSNIEKKYVNEALDASRLSQGDMVNRFEKQFARLHDQKYGIACNSGTSALHVGLEAMKEKFGWDVVSRKLKVLVPAITFIATSNAVMHAGMIPVFVDVDPVTYNMNPKEMEAKIDEDTVAVIPVHTFGQPCEMDEIVRIAREHELKIMEDCAEGHFATYKGKKVGSFSDIAAYSTYVAHTITTGIGGVITTNDRQMMEISRSLIAHGRACTCEKCLASDPTKVCPLRMQTEMDKRFMMVRMGYSYRVGELEGALGLGQLENRDFIMNTRKANAKYLTDNLHAIAKYIQLPTYPYPMVVKKDAPFSRDEIIRYLESNNIETRPMLPLLCQPIYKQLFGDIEKEYPVAEWIDHYGFYVGCHHGLSKEQLDKIVETIITFVEGL